jgi:hypothetical protein
MMNKKMKLLLGSGMALAFASGGQLAAGWFDSPDKLTVMQEKVTAENGSGYGKSLRKFEITQEQVDAAQNNKKKIKSMLNRLDRRASAPDEKGNRTGSIPKFLDKNKGKLMADEEEAANNYIKDIDRIRDRCQEKLNQMSEHDS